MSSSVAQGLQARHRLLSENPLGQAKAASKSLRKAENVAQPQWLKWGKCIDEVRGVFRLTLKEFAQELQKEPRQVQRWVEGRERPQLEAVLAVDRFQGPLVIALARSTTGIEVDTVIHIRRTV